MTIIGTEENLLRYLCLRMQKYRVAFGQKYMQKYRVARGRPDRMTGKHILDIYKMRRLKYILDCF